MCPRLAREQPPKFLCRDGYGNEQRCAKSFAPFRNFRVAVVPLRIWWFPRCSATRPCRFRQRDVSASVGGDPKRKADRETRALNAPLTSPSAQVAGQNKDFEFGSSHNGVTQLSSPRERSSRKGPAKGLYIHSRPFQRAGSKLLKKNSGFFGAISPYVGPGKSNPPTAAGPSCYVVRTG